jgi:pantothenate kinase
VLIPEFFTEIEQILESGQKRTIIGIVGKPGAGKSTVGEEISKRFSYPEVSTLSMDGYHLSNEELAALGRLDRKGAPDTFNSKGFTELIRSLRDQGQQQIRFPIFHREIEASIPNEGIIEPTAKVVIVEGNYLLASDHGWGEVRKLLDKTFFINIDDNLRLQRLIARHIRYGKSPEDAKAWSLGSDEANASFIELTRQYASDFLEID